LKKAFTLIELLVVIAIIAILAAILFPVFAQAKVQAKGTASLSNNKQESLAAIMYSTDTDDIAVLDGVWKDPSAPMTWGGDPYEAWTWLTLPYTKNSQIFVDPLTSPVAVPAGWPVNVWNTMVGNEYGYNYTVFSPTFGATDVNGSWIRVPISLTSVARPSDIVLFTEHETYNELGAYWYGPGTLITLGGDEPPDCNTIAAFCFTNWGLNTWLYGAGLTTAGGANTGMIPLRKTNTTPTTFADGHAKVMTAGALSIGTNWSPTLDQSLLVVNNKNVYRWISTQ